MEMLYIMLGFIIVLLTFVAVGSVAADNDKEGARTMGIVFSVAIAAVLGAAYFFLGR